MKLTKERKVYAGVIVLGLGVLGADRLFLGGGTLAPASASAAGALGVAKSSPSPSPAAAPGEAPRADRAQPLAVRLQALSGRNPADADGQGLFYSSAAWIAPPEPEEPAAAAVEPRETLKDILARHRFSALVEAGSSSFLLVDGARVGLGSVFDGVTLLRVEKGKATFARGEERETLDFQERGAGR